MEWPSEYALEVTKDQGELKDLRIKSIEWYTGKRFVRVLKLKMNEEKYIMPTFGATNNHEVTGNFEIPEDKEIKTIEMWYSPDDKDIESFQFYDQNGDLLLQINDRKKGIR